MDDNRNHGCPITELLVEDRGSERIETHDTNVYDYLVIVVILL